MAAGRIAGRPTSPGGFTPHHNVVILTAQYNPSDQSGENEAADDRGCPAALAFAPRGIWFDLAGVFASAVRADAGKYAVGDQRRNHRQEAWIALDLRKEFGGVLNFLGG